MPKKRETRRRELEMQMDAILKDYCRQNTGRTDVPPLIDILHSHLSEYITILLHERGIAGETASKAVPRILYNFVTSGELRHWKTAKNVRATLEHYVSQYDPVSDGRVSRLSDMLPKILIAWDPDVVSPEEYASIVKTLGDIVRANGGAGVEFIKGNGFNIEVKEFEPA